jgi:hypothetical protein
MWQLAGRSNPGDAKLQYIGLEACPQSINCVRERVADWTVDNKEFFAA